MRENNLIKITFLSKIRKWEVNVPIIPRGSSEVILCYRQYKVLKDCYSVTEDIICYRTVQMLQCVTRFLLCYNDTMFQYNLINMV